MQCDIMYVVKFPLVPIPIWGIATGRVSNIKILRVIAYSTCLPFVVLLMDPFWVHQQSAHFVWKIAYKLML